MHESPFCSDNDNYSDCHNAHHCSMQLEKYSFICIRYGSLCLEFKNYVGCIDRPPPPQQFLHLCDGSLCQIWWYLWVKHRVGSNTDCSMRCTPHVCIGCSRSIYPRKAHRCHRQCYQNHSTTCGVILFTESKYFPLLAMYCNSGVGNMEYTQLMPSAP